jgi:hypothetical protein
MADEKYFYHSFVSPCFALECPTSTIVSVAAVAKCPIMQAYRDTSLVASRYFAMVSGLRVICSEITDCGKSEQN